MERMKNTHRINEYVIYKSSGISKIDDIRAEDFGSGEKLYYVLRSVYNDRSLIYVPVDSEELSHNMRHILSADEIQDVIHASEESENQWIDNSKARALYFEEILNSGDRAELIWLVKVLSTHKLDIERQKKKLYSSDARILSSAEKAITEEFAFVLGIPKTDVIPYIISQTKNAG